MVFTSDTLLAACALTTIFGLILLVTGVTGLRKRPTEAMIVALIGEAFIIVGFLASRRVG